MQTNIWDSTLLDVGQEVQTFVDDLLIASVQDVKRSWHTPIRVQDQPLLTEDRPWEHDDEQQASPRGPCPGAWMTPVIRHDGQLTVCCVDVGGQLALGNLAEHGFRELWEGAQADALRMDHVQGRFERHSTCAHCGGIAWYGFAPETVRAWLERAGRPDLWDPYQARMGLTPS